MEVASKQSEVPYSKILMIYFYEYPGDIVIQWSSSEVTLKNKIWMNNVFIKRSCEGLDSKLGF